MRAPQSPAALRKQVNAELSGLLDACSRVTEEYEWAYRAAHDRTVRDEAKVQVHGADPTQAITLEKGRMRRSVATSGRRLHEALAGATKDVEAEIRNLQRALGKLDPAPRPEPTRYPRTASRDELRHAHEAQDRRTDRGEGWGDA